MYGIRNLLQTMVVEDHNNCLLMMQIVIRLLIQNIQSMRDRQVEVSMENVLLLVAMEVSGPHRIISLQLQGLNNHDVR